MSCTVQKHYMTPTTPNNRYYYPDFTKEETRLKKSRHIASKDFKLRYYLTQSKKCHPMYAPTLTFQLTSQATNQTRRLETSLPWKFKIKHSVYSESLSCLSQPFRKESGTYRTQESLIY